MACKVIETEGIILNNGKVFFVGGYCVTQAGFVCSFAKNAAYVFSALIM